MMLVMWPENFIYFCAQLLLGHSIHNLQVRTRTSTSCIPTKITPNEQPLLMLSDYGKISTIQKYFMKLKQTLKILPIYGR